MPLTFPFSLTLAHVVIALSASIFSQQSFASGQKIDCPTEMPTALVQFTGVPDGWTPFVPQPLALTSAGFMQASPEKMAHLKPFSTSENRKHVIVTWKFEGDYLQGKWLACDYAGGAVSLSKEIDRSISSCTVVYEKKNRSRAGFVQQVVCK